MRLKCNKRKNIAGIVSLARLEFLQKRYMDALKLYKQALRECPTAPAEVRLGLGACYFRLGNTSKAEEAYRRVLELNPRSIQALLGLAVLTLAVGAGCDATRDGSRLLARAFEEDPHDPHVLILLAHFSLQQGLADHARILAQSACELVSADEIELKAQATCLLARAHHALGSMTEAVKFYSQALNFDKSIPIARLAIAQVHILRGELQNAATILQQVLLDQPAWIDALRLLAPICPRQPTAIAAAAPARHFKSAAERNSDDPELWQMLSDVIAAADPAGALDASMKAISLYRKRGGVVPARLLNNAAVSQLRAGAPSKALQLMNEAMNSAAAGGLEELGPQAQVTLGFNSARIQEAIGNVKIAEKEYKAILSQFPQYADCYVRLSLIAKERGDFVAAESAARAAAAVPGREIDALAILAELHLDRKDIAGASKCLEEMEKKLETYAKVSSVPLSTALRQETYLRIAKGNVYLASVPPDISKEELYRKAKSNLSHAITFFKRVLQDDTGNISAANGIGCVLAEAGWLKEAREIFLRVQEAIAGAEGFIDLPTAWVNLANTFTGLREFSAAEQTFYNSMKRFPHLARDARCQLYLSKALVDGGSLENAKRVLCRGIHLQPNDPKLRFNVAYVMQKSAEKVLSMKPGVTEAAIAQNLREAISNLETSKKVFSMLRAAGHDATGLSDKNLDHHIGFIEKQYDQGKIIANQADERAKIAALRLEEQKLRAEAEAAEREVELQRKREEEKALRKAMEEQAAQSAARLERLKGEWKQAEELAKAAKAGDSSAVAKGTHPSEQQPDQVDALFAVGSDEEDEDYVPGKERETDLVDNALQNAGLVSSDEEPEANFTDSGEEVDEDLGKPNGEGKSKKSKSRLKKRVRTTEVDAIDTSKDALNDDHVSNHEISELGDELGNEDIKAKRPRIAENNAAMDELLEDNVDDKNAMTAAQAKALFGSDSE